MIMLKKKPVALLLLLPFARSTARFEGRISDMIIITDATDPPAIRALSTRTLEMATILEYTREDLMLLGISPTRSDGVNRTLLPSGVALLEGSFADTIYWTDAGAGAVLGMRFDSSGLRILAHGLRQPEALVLDNSAETWQAIEGHLLYWGDAGTNKIQRCQMDLTQGGAGNCTAGVVDVKSDVSHVAGLALNPVTSTLYWADGHALRVYALPINTYTGLASTAPTALQELVSFVAMPTALALETASGASLNAERLYVLDQAKPTRLARVWLNGNVTQQLVGYGLSRPRAIGIAKLHHFFCIVDSGRKSMLLGSTGQDTPALRVAYTTDGAFEPRGVAIRSDAELLISLTGQPVEVSEQNSAAAPRTARRGGDAAVAVAAAFVAAALVVRSRKRTASDL